MVDGADHSAQVVDASQAVVKQLTGFEEVVEISAGVVAAGRTVTCGIDGAGIQTEPGLADFNAFGLGFAVVE